MLAKKTMMWIGAGLMSAVTIPAIGATVHHHRKLTHLKATTHVAHTVASAAKPAVKTVAHVTKPTTLIASHTVKKHKTLKTAKSVKAASTSQYSVLAMHGGTGAEPHVTSHLLAATTTKKKTNR
jgi:hypothetical protein